ncbi:MAG: DUF4982 domain-containing protein [Rikenellaceae bacterium]|nr:DUF4982 domain-containing protein [Rikenellaceae bacterium]
MKRQILSALLAIPLCCWSQQPRREVPLDGGWKTMLEAPDATPGNYENPGVDDRMWTTVAVPHNWDQYYGYRQLRHGNLHGTAWYRNTFTLAGSDRGRQVFLYFEGVGSYATVWVNGRPAGYHAGGRTTFTLDVTDIVSFEKQNTLAVKAEHPALIADLPWVCGGCSGEWGFSEGSQPLGIFRPVTLVVTDPVRIEPFGVHVWNGADISSVSAVLHFETEVKNYSSKPRGITLKTTLTSEGKVVFSKSENQLLAPETAATFTDRATVRNPRLWSPDDPFLYELVTEVFNGKKLIDRTVTPCGIRWISWPQTRGDSAGCFAINGRPFFINGTCEYEHLMGVSHAFTAGQIAARARQIKAAGFNAFRDAHQPHNLAYSGHWDTMGILWWAQMSAHIWYDTPEFRENFRQLLRDFVKERRNSPSIILWGLQNESVLPEAFARECTEIIRRMDPTASSQRLVTTCNGGTGTDWNVVQNWSGTYGGNPAKYADELSSQWLNGEYGAWRSIDRHSEGPFNQNGPLSEDRMTQLMEMKVRQAEAVRDRVAGQFQWLLNSHENPGRIQNGEGFRTIDQVGPFNYKGLLTPWGEPLDAYYMYRSNYAPAATEPMVYIAMHTWPDRWYVPGVKDGIVVYSNCDEVELFNDLGESASLGRREREGGVGTHFVWDGADIRYNVLYAVGYIDGQPVAKDLVTLHHLPVGPALNVWRGKLPNATKPVPGILYHYRVNCGGERYTDLYNGGIWETDTHLTESGTWGSRSWADRFPGVPPFFGSQRQTHDPIDGTVDWPLFQSFRYGTTELKWEFPVPEGEYTVELYFVEPWYGTGGGMDCTGWRVFDVAVNDEVVLKDLDIFKEVGHDALLKKTVKVRSKDGLLTISFPRVTAGQAVISAIAVASIVRTPSAPPSPRLISWVKERDWKAFAWMTTGERQHADGSSNIVHLPPAMYGAEWLKASREGVSACTFTVSARARVFVAIDLAEPMRPAGMEDFSPLGDTLLNSDGERFPVFVREYAKGDTVYIGSASAREYTVAANYLPDMGEESVARPVTKLTGAEAGSGGAVETGTFKREPFVKLAAAGSFLEWEVNPGLAGTYLLRFRYMNHSGKAVPMRFEIVNALNGVVMKRDKIEFPAAADKFRIVSTSTGSMINAGLYKIRLTAPDDSGIEIESFEFE